uniref:J domain-containing protein n=1 Tax=Mycena chlorophos TaxID=658473 RepID=A0ABQ0LYV8_MYCCL|nr:predicted protein [Mycena chlorophos]
MATAFDDDDRLDSLEARMNDYAHVPERWRSASHTSTSAGHGSFADNEDLLNLDPAQMDDEEYAEWIRSAMYRKTHAKEYAEEQERKARREARRAEEKARRAETARLAAQAEEEHRRKKRQKEARRFEFARADYDSRWKALLLLSDADAVLTFADIPWPVLAAQRRSERHANDPPPVISLDALSAEEIAVFLVPDVPKDEASKKNRKEKLRETYLRFHPDKFEGRFMRRMRERDQEKTREAIGVVVRALNVLMDA